ncbi:predicted protein [Uncinocarpus reesii 1704]|uniref:Zn(2)-C6 fungal-type domain-containing protein n=1 Tax=Uncinocarpus reesii (strain UAMH 1704) TaxID=336963 RepID=C4JU82_UNCRE|nr:uncharacterized protein UREG_06021 [Uncinocarpus reesii 1704]EEP81179.1 predicted protein [Uncinocarpus reesii 1704]
MEAPNDFISQESPQGLAMEGSAGVAADKKRNKLGYHRTSVACVHCRRRKIRCLLAPDDPQGRCENCIRLKKECHFYPVDQQPPVEKRSRAGSKAEPPTPDASIVTTPTLLGRGPMMEPKDSYFPYPSMPVNETPEMATFNPGSYGTSTMSPYSPDPTTALGAVQPLAQPSAWETPSLYDQQLSGVPPTIQTSPPAGAIWDQNTPMTATISSLPAMSSTVNPVGLVPGNNTFGIVTDGSPWNLQSSATMPISSPEVTTPGYAGQLHAPLASEFKPPIGNASRLYPVPMSAPVTVLQPPTLPVSYDIQQQTLAYNSWGAINGPDISTSSQPIVTGIPDPMAPWYAAGDPVQYAHIKQEVPMVTSPLQPFDPGVPHPMQKP